MNDEFKMFWGVASGSSVKAMKQLEVKNIMINFSTYHNEPWFGIENLFVDSGGYSFLKNKKEYQTTKRQYISYIYSYSPDFFALRDYPCEPDLLSELNRSVKEHQDMTIKEHRELIDLYESWGKTINSKPVSVLQGYDINQYLDHYDRLKEEGLLTDILAIGSICARNNLDQIRRIVVKLRQEIPNRIRLHGFGIKIKSFQKHPKILKCLDSADTNAYDPGGKSVPKMSSHRISGGEKKTWWDPAFQMLKMQRDINRLKNLDDGQSRMFEYDMEE